MYSLVIRDSSKLQSLVTVRERFKVGYRTHAGRLAEEGILLNIRERQQPEGGTFLSTTKKNNQSPRATTTQRADR